MKKRYTEDIFRDKLKDYQETPDPALWDRIENSLNKRKRRRVIPIWWTMGGVAALLALGFFIFGPQLSDPLSEGVSKQPGVVKEATGQLPERENQEKQSISADQNQGEGYAGSETNDVLGNTEAVVRENVAQSEEAVRSTGRQPAENELKTYQEQALADRTPDTAENQSPIKEGLNQEGNSSQPGQPNKLSNDAELFPLTNSNNSGEAVASAEEETPEKGKISILDAAAEQEALYRNDDELNREAEKSKTWTVGPAVAPVFYSNFGDGSPLDQDFVSNSKSGTLNMSFGVAVAYAVTGKLSVRSGIHRVDFGYNTNQVSFTPTADARPASLIRTISYSENSRNVVVHSNVSGDGAQAVANSLDVSAPSPMRNGSMLQEFGYLEIPLEMQYALIEGKFGINVIGGMSSLFLVNNSVSLDSSGSSTEIGEANNINPVNFSSNLGLGLYYNLNSAMQLNLQPMFKYHMNAFSQTAGDFQPYTLGVYSGLSFRF